jgi:hypothetical protein
MENRDRDKLSRNTESTDAGDVNRKVSSRRGQEENISDAGFGQKIGQSERSEPSSRQSGSVGSSGMSGKRSSSDLESDLDSDKSSDESSDSSRSRH